MEGGACFFAANALSYRRRVFAAKKHSAFKSVTSLPNEFYRGMTLRLARCAAKMGIPQDQCEDLAQEAWMRALIDRKRFEGEHTLGRICAWLGVVVHNLAVDVLRHRDALLIDSLQALSVEAVDEQEAELVRNPAA
jgi:DNA-directed RNA polymerase specialized sigma24 family protein